MEALRDVRARDAIVNARYEGMCGWVEGYDDRQWAEVHYENEKRRVAATIRFHFVRVPIDDDPDALADSEWRIDLQETARQFVMSE